jgi:hypothetical protein|tara:strand:+ start:237 stop:398 length:162 start_codon:yes stop_codon:yes gene_type:complete
MSWLDLTDVKVLAASVAGIGNWLVDVDLILKVSISAVSLIYIILKIRKLLNER